MKLKNFALEVVFDCSFFERDVRGRRVFRYREEKVFVPIRAKNRQNARKKEQSILAKFRGQMIVTTRLYAEI